MALEMTPAIQSPDELAVWLGIAAELPSGTARSYRGARLVAYKTVRNRIRRVGVFPGARSIETLSFPADLPVNRMVDMIEDELNRGAEK